MAVVLSEPLLISEPFLIRVQLFPPLVCAWTAYQFKAIELLRTQ